MKNEYLRKLKCWAKILEQYKIGPSWAFKSWTQHYWDLAQDQL